MGAKLNGAGVVAAMMLMGLSAAPANALTIVVNNTGGLDADSAAGRAFGAAVKFYERVFTNDVTVNINAGFRPFQYCCANTRATFDYEYTADVEAQLRASAQTAVDAVAVANLPTLNDLGDISMIKSGYLDPVNHLGIDTSQRVYDTNDTANNYVLLMTTANAKALGFGGIPADTIDATITFDNSIDGVEWFDYDSRDFTSAGTIDFIGVALHELAHALGFISGVDAWDYYGAPFGPGAGTYATANLEDGIFGSPLDLFRYSDNPDGFAGGGPLLDWAVGGNPYFSLDRGQTVGMEVPFSTGAYNGSGFQASHWGVAEPVCEFTYGIVAPFFCDGESWIVTSKDLRALDAIGWNTDLDLLNGPYLVIPTGDIYAAGIPEPGVWMMMVAGLGLAGAALRRRRTLVEQRRRQATIRTGNAS